MLKPILIVPSEGLVVPLSEVKSWCDVDFNDDDALLTSMIKAATSYLDGVDGVLGLSLLRQEWRESFSSFSDVMRLSNAPIISILTIKYFDERNVEQTVPSGMFGVLEDAYGPIIVLNSEQSWPSVSSRLDAVKVDYTCGHSNEDAIPSSIKVAIKMLVADMYERRESQTDSVNIRDNHTANILIEQCRRRTL